MRSQVNQRLADICDLGCAIIAAPETAEPRIILVKNLQDWADSALSQGDDALSWMGSTIGIARSSDEDADQRAPSDGVSSPYTLASTYEGGFKVGLLAAHSKPELTDVEIRELTTAAQILIRYEQVTEPEENAITAKEHVYLQQVAGGALDDDIADDLGLSLRAIKERKRKAIEDMNAKNISHAVAKAKRNNLL